MAYDYYKAVKEDMEKELPKCPARQGGENNKSYIKHLIGALELNDNVTGALSGSYTSNKNAKVYVMDNIELSAKVYAELSSPLFYDLAVDINKGNWKNIDVLIRQYVVEDILLQRTN